jgi:hypothetical protein
MVQSVLYVKPVTGKDAVVGSAVNPFKTLTAYQGGFLCGFWEQTFHPQHNWRRIERITSLVQGLSLPKADLKLLEIYEDRVNIPAYGDVLLSLPYRTVRG